MSLSWPEILVAARSIVGNSPSNSASDVAIDDDEVRIVVDLWVDQVADAVGTSSSILDTTFEAVAGTQNYDIADNVDDAVLRIQEVVRSSGFAADDFADLVGGIGYQSGVFESMVALSRARGADQQSWEVSGDDLILMPPPEEAETVWVRYTTAADTFETLPDSARTAMVYAAVVALCDAILNRMGQSRAGTSQFGQADADFTKNLTLQRNRYDGMFNGEIGRLVSRRR